MNETPAIPADLSVSVIVLTYNQAPYVVDAVRSVLAQSYGPLEIVVSDDASTDATYELLEREVESYAGHHRIRLFRNQSNLGLVPHLNKCMELASGHLIVAAAGDDVSESNRVARLVQSYIAGVTYSIFSNASVIDMDGMADGSTFYPEVPDVAQVGPMDAARGGFYVLGATHAWDREVFSVFGPLPAALMAEDWAIPFRSLLLGRVEYVDEPLVKYRFHGGNIFHGRVDHLDTKCDWHQHLQRECRRQVDLLKSYRRDLSIATRRVPHRAQEFDEVGAALDRTEYTLRLREAMFLSSNPLERLSLVLRLLVRRGGTPGEIRRWLWFFGFPRVYLWRHRKAVGRRSALVDDGR